MHEEPTTVIIQRYLDALPGDTAAEPVDYEAVGESSTIDTFFLFSDTSSSVSGCGIALRCFSPPLFPGNREDG